MDHLGLLGRLVAIVLVLFLLGGCRSPIRVDETSTSEISATETATNEAATNETDTLASLEKLDDYPLYTMKFVGEYAGQPQPTLAAVPAGTPRMAWGCSLFATLAQSGDRLYGRNYDWRFSPALLLFTDPPDGYASVSMVDMEYLGFSEEQVGSLLDLPLEERRKLLRAFALPFDGMNERGLAVGMAAVPPGDMQPDPQKPEIGQLMVIREMLDHAATVEQAVKILDAYNIDMSEVPIHYLVASAAGESALVEFFQGEMVITHSSGPWQAATNFVVAATGGNPAGQCSRYDRIQARMNETQGLLTSADALDLLEDVSQDNTQWSVVYDMHSGTVQIVMGRQYQQDAIRLSLAMQR